MTHGWIISHLELIGINNKTIYFAKKAMSYWKTSMRLHAEGKITDDLEIKRGIFQGDSLSPLIFYISLIPLTEQLNTLLLYFSRVGLDVWFLGFFSVNQKVLCQGIPRGRSLQGP